MILSFLFFCKLSNHLSINHLSIDWLIDWLIEMRDAKPGFFDDRQNCEISAARHSTALSALDWNCFTILCTVLLFYV